MKSPLRGFFTGLLGVPVGVWLHEMGHLAAAYAVEYDTPRLERMTATYGTAGHPELHRLIVAACGPVVTTLLTVTCWFLTRRRPEAAIFALAVSLRGWFWLLIGLAVLKGIGKVDGGDEATIAKLSGLPLEAAAGVSVLLSVVSLGLMLSFLRRPKNDDVFEAHASRLTVGAGCLGVGLGWLLSLWLSR